MKLIHIPTFIIFGVSIFCISTAHFELVNAIQSCWTSTFVVLILTYNLSMMCMGKRIMLPKDKIMKTVCILGIIEILYSIIQLFGFVPNNFHYTYFSGSLNNPAIFGMLLSFCVPITVYYAVKTVGTEQMIWKTMTMTFGVFVILSDSRTAMMASICGTAIILTMEVKSLKKSISGRRFRLIGITCVTIALIALYLYKRNSANGRILIWNVCVEMIKDKPWFGWGFDGYVAQYMNYQADYLTTHPNSPFVLLAGETQSPFNEFLHIALIYGIPCAITFACVIFWTIWYIYTRVIEHKSVLLCTICVLVTWLMFSYPFNIPFVWLIILFVCLSMINRKTKPPMPKLCMSLVLTAGAACLYSLCVIGAYEIRKLSLQERAMNHCDEEIMKEYEEAYKEYYDDYMFIYNYGALLHLRGEYKKSLEVLNAGTKYLSDYNMILLIGDNYQKLKQYDLALASYKRAGEMIPSRYLPLYYRMELYLEMGDKEKAHETANIIINKENKIKESKLNQQIINKAKECLNY